MTQRGFSLLEALVTLVILSLVATVLMQSLVHVLGVRERVLRNERESRAAVLQEAWFRESIGAALADVPQGGQPLRGDGKRLTFLSLDTLEGGAFAEVRWMLVPDERGLALEHHVGARRWTLLTGLPEDTEFRYLDARGAWTDVWPMPADAADGPARAESLPRVVSLAATDADGAFAWAAAVGASPGLPMALETSEALRGGAL